jgi:uncharacterized membrane protein YcaP (DUF421 family)
VFHLETSGFEIAARTLVIYLALLAALRLAGKREIGQITTFDLVVILLVANAVQNAMVGPDTSLTGGLISAGVLIAANHIVALVRERIPWLRRAVEGTPAVLINNGEFVMANLRRESLDPDEVMMAIREHGVDKLEDVKMAILEVDGSISIVPKDSATIRTRRHSRFVKRGS